MTGRTHDLAAFTALNIVILTAATIPHVSLATGLVAFTANMVGGLAPDIDQPTADLWHKIPAGTLYARLFTPFLGGHRSVSHSLFGIVVFGILASVILNLAKHVLLVDMNVVWWCFMIGFISHLLMDTITREGVPWLFPVPFRFGIPPLEFLRVKTGGLLEKSVIFPGLIIVNAYIFYNHYAQYLAIFHRLS